GQELAVEEMRCVRNDNHGQLVCSSKFHGFVQWNDVVGFAMNKQGVIRQSDVAKREALGSSACQYDRIRPVIGQTRVKLGCYRRAKRKTAQHPGKRRNIGMPLRKLLKQCVHVCSFTYRLVELAI